MENKANKSRTLEKETCMSLSASFKRVSYQGLTCYLPVVVEEKDGKTRRIVLHGDPLATINKAKKYAQIDINRRRSK